MHLNCSTSSNAINVLMVGRKKERRGGQPLILEMQSVSIRHHTHGCHMLSVAFFLPSTY